MQRDDVDQRIRKRFLKKPQQKKKKKGQLGKEGKNEGGYTIIRKYIDSCIGEKYRKK